MELMRWTHGWDYKEDDRFRFLHNDGETRVYALAYGEPDRRFDTDAVLIGLYEIHVDGQVIIHTQSHQYQRSVNLKEKVEPSPDILTYGYGIPGWKSIKVRQVDNWNNEVERLLGVGYAPISIGIASDDDIDKQVKIARKLLAGEQIPDKEN